MAWMEEYEAPALPDNAKKLNSAKKWEKSYKKYMANIRTIGAFVIDFHNYLARNFMKYSAQTVEIASFFDYFYRNNAKFIAHLESLKFELEYREKMIICDGFRRPRYNEISKERFKEQIEDVKNLLGDLQQEYEFQLLEFYRMILLHKYQNIYHELLQIFFNLTQLTGKGSQNFHTIRHEDLQSDALSQQNRDTYSDIITLFGIHKPVKNREKDDGNKELHEEDEKSESSIKYNEIEKWKEKEGMEEEEEKEGMEENIKKETEQKEGKLLQDFRSAILSIAPNIANIITIIQRILKYLQSQMHQFSLAKFTNEFSLADTQENDPSNSLSHFHDMLLGIQFFSLDEIKKQIGFSLHPIKDLRVRIPEYPLPRIGTLYKIGGKFGLVVEVDDDPSIIASEKERLQSQIYLDAKLVREREEKRKREKSISEYREKYGYRRGTKRMYRDLGLDRE